MDEQYLNGRWELPHDPIVRPKRGGSIPALKKVKPKTAKKRKKPAVRRTQPTAAQRRPLKKLPKKHWWHLW
jgi:hypothetical protein